MRSTKPKPTHLHHPPPPSGPLGVLMIGSICQSTLLHGKLYNNSTFFFYRLSDTLYMDCAACKQGKRCFFIGCDQPATVCEPVLEAAFHSHVTLQCLTFKCHSHPICSFISFLKWNQMVECCTEDSSIALFNILSSSILAF